MKKAAQTLGFWMVAVGFFFVVFHTEASRGVGAEAHRAVFEGRPYDSPEQIPCDAVAAEFSRYQNQALAQKAEIARLRDALATVKSTAIREARLFSKEPLKIPKPKSVWRDFYDIADSALKGR